MLATTKPMLPAQKLQLIRLTMHRYISRITVESVLGRAIAKCGHRREEYLTEADLEGVVEECMVGLRLFVDEARLPDLMIALTEILMEPTDDQQVGPTTRTFSGTYRTNGGHR